jgi:TonB family protein
MDHPDPYLTRHPKQACHSRKQLCLVSIFGFLDGQQHGWYFSLMSPTILLLLALATTTPSQPTEQDVRMGNPSSPTIGVTAPKLVRNTLPLYTEEARRRSIEGVVTVQAAFDIDGNFKVQRVVKGLGYGLDENALTALAKWRFIPAYKDGQRVSVLAEIDVSFSLYDDPQSLNELNGWLENAKRQERINAIRGRAER